MTDRIIAGCAVICALAIVGMLAALAAWSFTL